MIRNDFRCVYFQVFQSHLLCFHTCLFFLPVFVTQSYFTLSSFLQSCHFCVCVCFVAHNVLNDIATCQKWSGMQWVVFFPVCGMSTYLLYLLTFTIAFFCLWSSLFMIMNGRESCLHLSWRYFALTAVGHLSFYCYNHCNQSIKHWHIIHFC